MKVNATFRQGGEEAERRLVEEASSYEEAKANRRFASATKRNR